MAELSRGRGGKKKVNVFQDWLVNVAGDAKPLKKKVLETVTGQEDFFMNMREQSRRFRNFYLKEEVDEEKLGDDRILYTATGVALKEKLKRQAEAKNAAAAEKARRAEEEARWVEEASWAGEAEGSPPEDLSPASHYSYGIASPESASPQPRATTPGHGGSGGGAAAALPPGALPLQVGSAGQHWQAEVASSRSRTTLTGSPAHRANANNPGSPTSGASGLGGSRGWGAATLREAGESRTAAREARTKALFQDFGLKISASEPSLGDMRKLLVASHARLARA